MDGGLEEDEYTSDPIAQQTRQVCYVLLSEEIKARDKVQNL